MNPTAGPAAAAQARWRRFRVPLSALAALTMVVGIPPAMTALAGPATGSGEIRVQPVSRSPAAARSAAAPAAAAVPDPVIAAAGDIACDPTSGAFNGGAGTSSSCRQRYTSDVLVSMAPTAVLTLGDNQYYCGSLTATQQVYGPTWGRLNDVVHPAPGNHEYLTSGGTGCTAANAGATGYFDYFGSAAGPRGKGWYSYDLGRWHLIALNSNCGDAGGCGSTSEQGLWLKNDLAQHRNTCVLAYWHIPLFSSGGRAAKNTSSFFSQLYTAGADLVLTGHDHTYERFAPQRADGTRDDLFGVREWVVGTGGANHTAWSTIAANSEARDNTTYGVLRLALHEDSYDWQFVREGTSGFTESGTGGCHGSPSDKTAPTAPTALTASAQGPGQVNLTWSPATDNSGALRYEISRGGTVLGRTAASTFTDAAAPVSSTAHDVGYSVRAVDYSYNASASVSATVSVPGDTTAPSVPPSLAATAVTATSVSLGWSPSSDDDRVAAYDVYRDGILVASPATPNFTDAGLQPQHLYTWTVTARDRVGNTSARSEPLSILTPPQPSTITLAPTADTFVRSDAPTTAAGSSNEIDVDGSPMKRTLIRFNVTGIAGRTVSSAVLRLSCVNATSVGGEVRLGTSTTWNESVTWNTAPTTGTVVAGFLPAVSIGKSYDVDLSKVVTADGTYSFDIVSTASDGAAYGSRESSTPPQLIVETAT